MVNSVMLILYYILYPFAYLVYGGKMYDFAFDLTYYLSSIFAPSYKDYVRFLYAQASQETGSFKSDLYKRSNNMFGMRVPSKRKYYGVKKPNNNYAFYVTPMHSILDVIEWYKMYPTFDFKSMKLVNVIDVVNWLSSKGYFTGNAIIYGRNVYKFYESKVFKPTNLLLTMPLPLILVYFLFSNKKSILS
ncbi:MAG: hypothetical protein FADNKDHG_01464 [Holosporales bacterium]